MYLVTDTGTVVEIGTLMTIAMDMETVGRDTEGIEWWVQKGAGKNEHSGGLHCPLTSRL